MSYFVDEMAELHAPPGGRRWIYVPYDQLSDGIGPLSRVNPSEIGIVMVESSWTARRRPYHRQKLALVMANGRHFALEQARRGVAVRFVAHEGPHRQAIEPLVAELGPLGVMRPAERELRSDLQPLFDGGGLVEIPHEGWLSTDDDFTASQKPRPPWRMDAFYRQVRRRTGLLMENDKPVGGKFSFDAENRKPWRGSPPAPEPPVFEPDQITREVAEIIDARFRHHPGSVDPASLPATAADAERLWTWACDSCLPTFGPYEDAMSMQSRGLFHTRISGLLNIHRLLPARVVEDANAMDLPLASKEGFLRQVLGWREFVRHVHNRSDGFRRLSDARSPDIAAAPGDAGWGRWSGRTWSAPDTAEIADGGACPSVLGADRPLPVGYWPGHPTGLTCLDTVVEDVWFEAWSHHITRLMVLSNIATLLGVTPRELTDWFWVAYLDAFDWVVEPNVLAMGSYAVGSMMTTKPYVSGAAYIDRMSDYCASCAFDPKKNCPITNLYWAFLDRHRNALKGNVRMRLILASLAKRSRAKLDEDRAAFAWVSRVLARGGQLQPDRRPKNEDG